ncbi:Clathrin interactor EPSIN 1 [Rhynchospora pubera]|uniref:Clathrin interactor EPSIN 1 n=1 Tax=Rhynchospora pubera TaxID=906938 RepID=A0AAV8C2F9_9POAL|nr:Clathrin interactor EPSIN 1 [Rhynchospora pubera]
MDFMDFKKLFHQAVREIKREVNLKVLNVPEIEQKVLDATSDEPWGPHGSDLSEIAQATKKFLDCDLAMNILWQRLNNTKANWRHLYKALVVIEYIIAHGSERAVDDIYDNISQITALSRFECVEPNGKDVGLNVRNKTEAILSILDDREKLQQVREKAAATRDKYIGLSSTGISNKTSSASFSSESYESTSNGYGSTNGSKEADLFNSNKEYNSYNGVERDQYSRENVKHKSQGSTLKDDFDEDFDPRAATATYRSANKSSQRVDCFVPNLMDDIFDTPLSTPNLKNATNYGQEEVDLFADAAFQSTTSTSETTAFQGNIDLFVNTCPEAKPKASVSGNKIDNSFDPFALMPLKDPDTRNYKSDQADEIEHEFGVFTSNTEIPAKPTTQNGAFQAKSGIWADSLSRGLINFDITESKKSSLADEKYSALSQSQAAGIK